LARTIVLVIRKRGGRFLKKDEETGELYEVGDAKAEAKTSQALREGLDVRATKSAASSLMDKKKKKSTAKSSKETNIPLPDNKETSDDRHEPSSSSASTAISKTQSESILNESSNGKKVTTEKAVVSPAGASVVCKSNKGNDQNSTPVKNRAESPPSLPKLNEGGPRGTSPNNESDSSEGNSAKAPPSPEQMQFRKRRRMRSADGGSEPTTGTCGVANPFQGDKLFPDFCPPRADLARAGSPPPRLSGDDVPHMDMCGMTPVGRSSSKFDDDDIRYEEDTNPGMAHAGCAGIALDMMTGAAAGSFCLGPRVWSKRG